MWTSTVLVADALPAQPLIVIALVTVVLSEIVTSVGFVPEQPGAPFTVNVNVAVRVALLPVPVTVTEYVPAGVDAAVAIVNVDEPPDVTDDGLNDAVAPDGKPEADNTTVCAEPFVTAVATVDVNELPGDTDPDDGDNATEKSLAAVVSTASVHNAYAAASPARLRTVSLTLLNVSQDWW